MANEKVSQLPVTTASSGSDIYMVVQAGVSSSISFTNLQTSILEGFSGGVSSLNTLEGALTLVAGTGITITPSGSNITIAATAMSGANQALSNLTSPVAINQNLLFNASNTFTIGDIAATARAKAVYVGASTLLGSFAVSQAFTGFSWFGDYSTIQTIIGSTTINIMSGGNPYPYKGFIGMSTSYQGAFGLASVASLAMQPGTLDVDWVITNSAAFPSLPTQIFPTMRFGGSDGTLSLLTGYGTPNIAFAQIVNPPSNPASGMDRLYFKSDDNLYTLNSSGIETQVTISGGFVPYTGATTTINVNQQAVVNASEFSVGDGSGNNLNIFWLGGTGFKIESNDDFLVVGDGAFTLQPNSGVLQISGAAIQLSQISTPAAPSSGNDLMYFKSTDSLYIQNSAGVEVALTPGSNWVSYTPTVANGPSGFTLSDCFWKRDGDAIKVKGYITFSTADGNGSVFELNVLPSPYTVDNTKNFADEVGTCGTMRYFRNGTGNYVGISVPRTTGQLIFNSAYTLAAFTANILQSGDAIAWEAEIPVTQFAF